MQPKGALQQGMKIKNKDIRRDFNIYLPVKTIQLNSLCCFFNSRQTKLNGII